MVKRIFGKAALVSTIASGALLAAAAHAQSSPATPPTATPVPIGASQADDASDYGDIVVTASKREQRLQDVPLAVSALTGNALASLGAQQFTDYARTVPGLTFQDTGAGRQTITIRGIVPTAGAAAVAYYIDETPLPAAARGGTAINPELVDIDRVEVLRGPQGTLYGSSSIGGTIKLVPTAPNLFKFEGAVKATASVTQGANGGSPGGDGQLVLNVPIKDGVAAVRGAFWGRDIGGFVNRTFGYVGDFQGATPPRGKIGNVGEEHTFGMRVIGLYKVTPDLSLSAMVYLQHQHFDGFTDITAGDSNPKEGLVQNFISDVAEPQQNDFTLYNVTAKYNFGDFNLVSTSSYNVQKQIITEEGTSLIQLLPALFGLDGVGAAFPNAASWTTRTKNFTQEVRLATTQPIAGFDLVVGGFYTDTRAHLNFNWSPPQYNEMVAENDPNNPLYAPGNNIFSSKGLYNKERQFAQFGEITYHITDRLSVLGGLRHYDVTTGEDYIQSGLFIGGNQPGITANPNATSRSHGFVYKGNISYKLTRDHLIYAQYAEGFRPGFGNPSLPVVCNGDAAPAQVEPDSIKSYEVGAKTSWLDRHVTINGAAYRIDWNRIQQGVLLQCGFGSNANFGKARINGQELEISARVIPQITAGITATHLDAKLRTAVEALGARAGDPIEYVPHWQFAANVQAKFTAFNPDDAYVRLDYQYTGSSWANYARLGDGSRDPASRMEAVTMLNARVGLVRNNWEFTLAANNVLNRTYRLTLNPNADVTAMIPGRPRYVVNRPRAFSISAGYKF